MTNNEQFQWNIYIHVSHNSRVMALNYNYKYVLYEWTNIYEPCCILHYSIRWERIKICKKIEINLHDTQTAATHYKSLLKNGYTRHNFIFSLHCYSVDAKITLQKTYFQILDKVDLILVCNQRCFNLDITTLTHRKVYVQTYKLYPGILNISNKTALDFYMLFKLPFRFILIFIIGLLIFTHL